VFKNFIVIGSMQQHFSKQQGQIDFLDNSILPQEYHSSLINFGLSTGAVILSHPFEVARVQIQFYQAKQFTFGSLTQCFASMDDGVLGLFRGLVPRMLTLLPVMMGYSFLRDYRLKTIQGQKELAIMRSENRENQLQLS
jgi:hypothetical protein